MNAFEKMMDEAEQERIEKMEFARPILLKKLNDLISDFEMVEKYRQETLRRNELYFKALQEIHNKFYDKFYKPEGMSRIELEDIVNDERLYGEAVDYCREYYNHLKG